MSEFTQILAHNLVILSLLKKGEKSLFEIPRYAQYDKIQHFLEKC